VNGEPVAVPALVLVGFVIAACLWLLSFLDDSAEIAAIRDEIDALPVIRRREVLAILERRIWR
jgi:hypothetical protein